MNTLKIENRSKNQPLTDLRMSGIVPGVLFGGGANSKMISMPEKVLAKFIDGVGAVYEVENKSSKAFVMFDEVQKDPVSNKPLHFSLKILPKGERSVVDVPLIFTGVEQKHGDKGLYVTLLDSVSVVGIPSEIPKKLEVDLSSLELGESYTIVDLCNEKNVEVENIGDTVLAQYQYINFNKNEFEASDILQTTEVMGEEDPIRMS